MRRLPLLALAALLAFPGCQLKAPDQSKAPKGASAKPSAAPVGPARMLVPGAGTVALEGQVFMDAGYARTHGKGQALPAGGMGLDGAHVISTDGSSLANAGGQIVAQGAGNVVVPAELIGNDGASLIGNDGGGIITNDGGSLINNGGSTYALAQAEGGGLGSSVPAAGMWLSVVDVRTGQALPLGTDDQGKPVTTIYTNAEGRFKVGLPADVAANVRVVARAPGSSDPRLALHVYETPRGQVRKVDEATAAATGYLRYLMADLMVKLANSTPDVVANILAETLREGTENGRGTVTEVFLQVIQKPLNRIRDAMQAADLQHIPSSRQYDICLLAADRLAADMDLASTKLDFTFYEPYDAAVKARAGQPALDTFVDAMEQLRLATARATSGDLTTFFAAKPYLVAANQSHPGLCRAIAKPADLADFVVKEYFATADVTHISRVDHVFYDLGLPTAERDLVRASGLNLYVEMTQRLIAEPETGPALADQLAELITTVAKAPAPAAPAAAPAACPPFSPEPTGGPMGRVQTLAGPMDGVPVIADVDGPGATARFAHPTALAYDPAANVAYVADESARSIRRLRFDAAGGVTVETFAHEVDKVRDLLVAGGKLYASQDDLKRVVSFALPDGGAPEVVATGFKTPSGLVMDPAGHLLVADNDANMVYRVGDGGQLVPFYGSGRNGLLDALVPTEAAIESPEAMAISPDGKRLYVTSITEGQIHWVDLATGHTDYLAGGELARPHQDGLWANARLSVPRSMAFGPDGLLYLTDDLARLRVVDMSGYVRTLFGPTDTSKVPYSTTRGFKDGPADQALADVIGTVAVLPDGRVIFPDHGNGAVRAWSPR